MAVAYKDFFPTVVKSGFLGKQYESLYGTLRRANQWMTKEQINLINIETVVLPNLADVQDASKAAIRTSGELSSHWFQVVRVWYEAEDYPEDQQDVPPQITT